MRTYLRSVSLSLAGCLVASVAAAQQSPELPAPSPKAKVEQRVGLTDFVVEYSSPGVKGRKIWGEVVPWDKPWRSGANAATKLVASKDFKFGDKAVPAGSYSFYTVPAAKGGWQVVLNSAADIWGTQLDASKDVARLTLKPENAPLRERLAYIFSNTTDEGTRLDLEWEKVRVSIPITVDTKTQAMANIDKTLDEAWRPHMASARWLLENNGDLARALTLADQSIAIKPVWWNNWIRAQILQKQGKSADALAAVELVQKLGVGDRVYEGFFKTEVEKAVGDWKRKS
jgi:hypothetical protein